MIKFLYTKIQGFGSIKGPLTYYWNESGLNILQGRNGSGKTTIFSAFVWSLYGRLLKDGSDPEPWPSIRDKDFIGTKVITVFKVGGDKIKVIRHLNYKGKTLLAKGKDKLILIVNGKQRSDLRDKKDVQSEIISILGYKYELFKNSIVFGQKLKRIIQESGSKQKEIFEQAFEVSYISKAKKQCEEKRKELEQEYSIQKTKYKTNKDLISYFRDELNRSKKLMSEFNNDKIERSKKLDKDYEEIEMQNIELTSLLELDKDITEDSLKDIEKSLKKLEKDKNNINSLTDEIFRLETERDTLNAFIEEKQNKSKVLKDQLAKPLKRCIRCQQEINKDIESQQKEEIRQEIRDLKAEINESIEKVQVLKSKIIVRKEELNSMEHIDKDISSLNRDKKSKELKLKGKELTQRNIDNNIQRLKDIEKQKIENESMTLNIDIKSTKRKYDKAKSEFKDLCLQKRKLFNKLNLYRWAIYDPLSNSGLKAFIFDQMLKEVNNKLFNYSKELGYRISFAIDMESKRKDFITYIYKADEIIPYEDLSGGQQQLVDICLAFAIHDVVAETNCNILLMDEVFENLDDTNIEIVGDIIKHKSINKSIHLVTHRTNFDISYARINKVTLHKGITNLDIN